MSQAVERVRDVVEPLLAARDVELYDVEVSNSMLRVIVDRPGGIDLDVLGDVTREVSRALDELDPIAGRYTLEVTSPGVERPLKRPEQFIRAVGEQVWVKTTPEPDGVRRVQGELVSADETGVTLRVDGEAAEQQLPYDEIAKARTVFDWGVPGPSAAPGKNEKKRERRS